MKTFLKNILYSGIQDRLGPEQQVKLLFINSIIFFGLVVLTVFAVRDLFQAEYLLGVITFAVSGCILGLYLTIWLTKDYRFGVWVLPFLMFFFFSYLTASGGGNASTVLWMLTYPLIVTFLVGSLWGSVFSAAFLAVHLVLFFVPGLSPVAAMETEFKMRMLGVYAILFTFSVAFEVIRMRAQTDLETTANELAAAKVQTDGILHSVTEGIFLLDKNVVIGDQHSTSLAQILGIETPAGRNLCDTMKNRIGDRDRAAAQDYLEMYFLPDPPWHLMEEINPLSQVSLASPDGSLKHLTFTFNAVELSTGRRVLATVRDVTQSFELSKRLKEEEDRSARQMKHLFQIIHVKPELMLQFLQDADEEIATINRRLKDPKSEASSLVEDLFQGVHAVKGNAALVGLSAFAQRVHDLESKVADFRGKKPAWQDFLDLTVRLSVIQAELTEIRELLGRMSTFQRGLEASAGGKDLLLLSLEKAVEKMGQDTGRGVTLDTQEFQPEVVPERYRKLVKDVLVQLVRNSFAHGLETGAERQSAGKTALPRIRVAARPNGRHLSLAYWDDGRGIDPKRLRQAALKTQGWTGDPSGLTDDEALQLVFAPGVSTAESTDLHAGRGVGLGLVKERVEAAGGRVKLRSVPGRGVAFDITLPMA